ncbi:elongator complex protein 5 [Nymphaea colorata]|nr:elongator complex protein 5 [Nymphaea colorata]XP_031476169.1 elongator complex protein 5 [Nymphaea colorata]
MVESVARILRDGVLEGEYAPALIIKDSLSMQSGLHVFDHFLCNLCSNISSSRSQARGLVVVTFARKPAFYFDLLKRRGVDTTHSERWLQILDCYSDPLGWKDKLLSHTQEHVKDHKNVAVFKDVTNTNKLIFSILDLGKEIIGQEKGRFSVAIDLVTELIRHTSLQLICSLINNFRSHDQLSSLLWSIHSDLHEPRTVAALDYLCSMTLYLDSMVHQPTDVYRSNENLSRLEQNSNRGRLHLRLKRRNGRVKILSEEFLVENGGVKFVPVSSGNAISNESCLPKVQFNLQLTEKERTDRAKVVLPFEHQGNGEHIEIYDGRRSLARFQKNNVLSSLTDDTVSAVSKVNLGMDDDGKGQIHYVRDSDDEKFDSDEDPDDDLDI